MKTRYLSPTCSRSAGKAGSLKVGQSKALDSLNARTQPERQRNMLQPQHYGRDHDPSTLRNNSVISVNTKEHANGDPYSQHHGDADPLRPRRRSHRAPSKEAPRRTTSANAFENHRERVVTPARVTAIAAVAPDVWCPRRSRDQLGRCGMVYNRSVVDLTVLEWAAVGCWGGTLGG